MIDWPLVLIVLVAVVVLGGLLGLAAWWYLPPADLLGLSVSASADAHAAISADAQRPGRAGESSSDKGCPVCGALIHGIDPCPGVAPFDVTSSDDDWADQLHEINQLGKFGDLTRPVAHMTHYEVEALIRQLGVAEWLPERLRAAA